MNLPRRRRVPLAATILSPTLAAGLVAGLLALTGAPSASAATPAGTTGSPTTTTTTTVGSPSTTTPVATTAPSTASTTVPVATTAPATAPPPTASPTTASPTTSPAVRAGTQGSGPGKGKKHGGVPKVPTSGGAASKGKAASAAATAKAEAAAVGAADAAIDRLEAITAYQQLRHRIVDDRAVLTSARTYQASVQAAADQADAHRATEAAESSTAHAQLARLALAAYTGEIYATPVAGPDALDEGRSSGRSASDLANATELQDAEVMIQVVTKHEELAVRLAREALTAATKDVKAADRTLDAARKLVHTDEKVLTADQAELPVAALAAEDGPAVASAPLADGTGVTDSTGSGTTAASRTSGTAIAGGPSVLGPSLLTAGELAAWYGSTPSKPNTTVPMAQLAADYLAAGKKTGVRADVAFAQSIVETDYFEFPSFGQVTKADNNFAGIGACDSCASGWSFPSALTGVTAQMELLEAYASPVPVSTPLIGSVGVGGCCTTWMALSGTWATNLAYGIEILRVYTRIVDWVIPRRLAEAGLAPATTSLTAPG